MGETARRLALGALALAVGVGCATGGGDGADSDAPSFPGGSSSGASGSSSEAGVTGEATSSGGATSTTSTPSTSSATSSDPSTTTDASGSGGSTGSDTTGATTGVPSDRVQAGLLALYVFSEDGGTDIADVSGVGASLDLQAADASSISWDGPGFELIGDTIVSSAAAADKLTDAITASEAFTVEAWVAPANLTQTGPARIVTLSADAGNRNFTLGQSEDDYVLRVRTNSADNLNGTNPAATALDTVTTAPTHVVATRSAAGELRIYLNAISQTLDFDTHAGDLSNWDSSYQLALGDEVGADDRFWQGEYHLVAVYDRALDLDEVEQNFLAGP